MSNLVVSRLIGRIIVEVTIDDIADQPGLDAVVHPTKSPMKPGGGVG
jgi:hypothetical protein